MSDEKKVPSGDIPVDSETLREISRRLKEASDTFTELADSMQSRKLSVIMMRLKTLIESLDRIEGSGRSGRGKLEKAAGSLSRDRISAGKKLGRRKRN